MRTEIAVDGFHLRYDRYGNGSPVVLLHGWPGDRRDFLHVIPELTSEAETVVPDLRGFGESTKLVDVPSDQYGAAAQARSVAGLIEELGLNRPVVAGYDIGSRIAQALAMARPDLVRALVISPPLPGIGRRILEPRAQQEFWYQAFHQLPLAEQLLDGNRQAIRSYLGHFWARWSGPDFVLDAEHLEHLIGMYARPGAFAASIAWYRAGAGAVAISVAEDSRSEPASPIAVPTTVLWPEHDALYPPEWSDRLNDYFIEPTLHRVAGAGHFAPLEYPQIFARAVRKALKPEARLEARPETGGHDG